MFNDIELQDTDYIRGRNHHVALVHIPKDRCLKKQDLEFLLAHQEKIPEGWRGKNILFPDAIQTIMVGPWAYKHTRYMEYSEKEGKWTEATVDTHYEDGYRINLNLWVPVRKCL
jgi:hypothetical protein